MSRATLEQDKKKTRAKDGPGAETDRKEREEYGEETDELEDDVPQGGRMSLLAHLNELRRRLTICAVCFLVGVALCLSQAEWFTNLLLSRGENFSFVYIAPAELMMTYVRISLVGGVVIIIPVIIYHIWRFLQPGLKRAEQMGFNLIITVGLLLFCLGALFAFTIVLPILLRFFARLNTSWTVTAMVSVQEYVSYVISTMLIFGVIFETPIVLVALTGVGLVKPKTLQKNFKYVVLIILIVAAVITPPAKPSMAFWLRGLGSPDTKNTAAAPRTVIKKVNPVPAAARHSAYHIALASFQIRAENRPYASIAAAGGKGATCFSDGHVLWCK